MPWIIVLLTLIEFSSAKLASIGIYWNASNPIFRIDNTDHIIDVNRGNNPFEYDQVNIICPTYTEGTNEEAETYIIYNVSKEEYDSCRITNSNARIIAICDNPHQLKYFTITFRSFTPQPGGLEFKPGQDYYFISTSTGKREGLDRRLGGRCSTHHMKVIFKVCCSSNNNNNNNNVLNDKSDANNNIIKNNSNINSTINNNQSFPSTTVDSSSLSSSELFIESSSSSSISSSTSSASTPSSVSPLATSSNLIFTLTSSSPSPSIQSNKDFINRDFNSDDRSLNGLYLNANPIMVSTSSPPSTSTTLGSLVTSTFPASPEHWWRPHFTRIQDLKWRSKSPGNVVKETNHHPLTVGHDSNSFTNPNANNSQNSSNDTLRPIAWTIFAIACFIFIIFWALWCKVRRNNVMLPMSK